MPRGGSRRSLPTLQACPGQREKDVLERRRANDQQAVTLGLSEESAEVLTQQMYTFLSDGYLRVGDDAERAARRRKVTRTKP